MAVEQLNIKNRTYYFHNDLVNALNFEPNNLKLDKKTWKDIDIYYIGNVDKNKPEDWRVKSVYPLYLIINKVFCSAGEENGSKCLKIEKYHSEPALKKWSQVLILLNIILKKLAMRSQF